MPHDLDLAADFLQIFRIQVRLLDNFHRHTGLGQPMNTQSDNGEISLAQISWGQIVESDSHQPPRFGRRRHVGWFCEKTVKKSVLSYHGGAFWDWKTLKASILSSFACEAPALTAAVETTAWSWRPWLPEVSIVDQVKVEVERVL